MNQRGPAEPVGGSELTERAAGMLDSALAIGDSQGIADAVVNLADALIKQAEADGRERTDRTALSTVHWTSLMTTSSTSALAISTSASSSGRARRCY